MAKDHGPSVKDDRLYEELRDDGAARRRRPGSPTPRRRDRREQKGGKAEDYEERTKEELEERARELDIEGYSQMSKDELIDALRNH